jgi:nicotinamidase-related amidase
MQSIHLVVIDPQNDFCHPDGSLYVPKAEHDMKRVAGLVDRLGSKIKKIHVTLDSHRRVDISHPIWWKDSSGKHPDPFTMISAQELKDSVWTTTQPGLYKRTLAYLEALEQSGRYPHVIWPEHCLIGDEGHNIAPVLSEAIHNWEDRFAMADFITKGSNPYTEHFSGVKAEVPDPQDPDTQVNTRFIQTLEDADIILLSGEALSHCLLSTVEDIAAEFSDESYIKKMVLLEDCASVIPDPPGTTLFSDKVAAFLKTMKSKGMQVSRAEDFLN